MTGSNYTIPLDICHEGEDAQFEGEVAHLEGEDAQLEGEVAQPRLCNNIAIAPPVNRKIIKLSELLRFLPHPQSLIIIFEGRRSGLELLD